MAMAVVIIYGVITGQALIESKAGNDLATLCKSSLNKTAGLKTEAEHVPTIRSGMIARMLMIATVKSKSGGQWLLKQGWGQQLLKQGLPTFPSKSVIS